jgi:glycosyltransferase involved in cell wall biosynthesis
MATMKGRKELLARAVMYWWRQDYPNKELIIVDDDPEMAASALPVPSGVTYIHVPKISTLGAKLNIASAAARGEFLHKIDDDDWYRSDLISASVRVVFGRRGRETQNVLVALDRYYTILLREWEFYHIGPKLKAGTSMFFGREMWERRSWNEGIERGADWEFYRDHPTHIPGTLSDPGFCTTIRHGLGHAWVTRNDVAVEQDFKAKGVQVSPYALPMSADDLEFYRRMRGALRPEFGAPTVAVARDPSYWNAKSKFGWGSQP